MSTFGVTGTQGGSRALQRSRSRWNNSCSCLIFESLNISIQTILLVVFLPVFRDEDAQKTLQSCVSGSGSGCLIYHLLYWAYKRFRERSNQLPLEAVSVSPGFEADELQTGHRCQRFGIQILTWLWRLLDVFFQLWFMVGLGIVYTSWVTRQAPHLNWLCTAFLVIAYFPYTLVLTVVIPIFIWRGITILFRNWPWAAKANVISAEPMYKFHAQVSDLETNEAGDKGDDVARGVSIRVRALMNALEHRRLQLIKLSSVTSA